MDTFLGIVSHFHHGLTRAAHLPDGLKATTHNCIASSGIFGQICQFLLLSDVNQLSH